MQKRQSEMHKTYNITEDQWVLTTARKTTGSHQQHVFFILEGLQEGKAVVWFMDLVGPGMSVALPNVISSKIRSEKIEESSAENLKNNPLIYRCEKRLMDLKPEDAIAEIHGYIDQDEAIDFIQKIELDRDNPPIFNIFGKRSLIAGSSAISSSNERGHNCFTYAREKLNTLSNPGLKIEGDTTAHCIEHVACFSSLTLKPTVKTNRFCPAFSKYAMTGALIVTAGALEITRRYYQNS